MYISKDSNMADEWQAYDKRVCVCGREMLGKVALCYVLSWGSTTLRNTAGYLSPAFLETFLPSSVLSNSLPTTGSPSCNRYMSMQMTIPGQWG